MTGFSTGTGGTIGGSPTPLPYEQQTSAAYVNAQINAGITSDTLEHPISNMMRTSVWKYLASSSNPNLATFLTKMRVSGAVIDGSTEAAINEEFNRLWEELPEDVRQRYNLEQTLPQEEREPAFEDLRATIQTMATFTAWITRANAPINDVSEAAERNADYLALPEIARQGMVAFGSELLGGLQQRLQSMGHNDPHFEVLSRNVNRLSAALDELKTSGKTDLSKLVSDLESWSLQFASIDSGANLRILGQLFPIMAIITAASAIDTGSASLLLGLSTALIGINRAESSLGILPADLVALITMLSTGLLTSLLPNADSGSAVLLRNVLLGASIAAISVASLAQTELGNQLQFELLMLGALSSKAFDVATQAIAAASGADERTKPVVGRALTLASVILMVQAYADKDQAKAAALVETFKPYLNDAINELEPYISAAAANSDNDAVQRLNVMMQQAKVALETDKYDEFVNAMQTTFKLADKDMGNFTQTLSQNFVKGGIADSKPITGIFQG